jgi:light-regulated signal transduction histidine kinase (bacteriophytochrome)
VPEKTLYKQDERIEKIYELLLQYTTTNDYTARIAVSDKGDELDAIIVGLNTLGEELQSSGKTVKQFEKRISSLMEILLQYTLMDFSVKAEVTEAGDELDAIAVGLNTLAEELQSAKEIELLHTKSLEEKTEEVTRLNKSLEKNIEALEISNKELEAFTYSVSHDLRSPLRAIHGYTKILTEDYADKLDEDAKAIMDNVMRNAKKMGQLIDDLLTFSRTGKKELQKNNVDMTALAKATVTELKTAIQPSNAKVNIRQLPPAYADYNLISLVFVNLISNAIKYSATKEKPVITIGAAERKEGVVYFVEDNGVGFNMQYYDKLFGVFQRLHSAEQFEGTGVGLALVKRIINRHGGKVWAEAKEDEGATFYFTLYQSPSIP